jgi:hypothetical protein
VRRQAGFGERRHLGNERIALRARHQQALDLALVDLSGQVEIADDQVHHLHVAALERQHGLGRALEGNVNELGAGLVLEPLDDQVGIAAHPERAEIELVGMLLRIGDQLLEILHRHALVQDQHLLRERDVGDRLEILQRIVGQVLVERRIDRDRAARQQADGGAIGRRRLAGIGRDDGVGAGPALDHEAMRVALLERLAERAHHYVDGAAGRERDQHPDRARRIARLGKARAGNAQACTDRQRGESGLLSKRHRFPPYGRSLSERAVVVGERIAESAHPDGWLAGAAHCTT